MRRGAVGAQLRQPIPSELTQLLLEADGIRGQFLVEVVWDSARIARDNSEFRSRPDNFASLYQPFDDLIFFGDNGGGVQFAVKVDGSAEPGVFVWEHETDARRKVADNLRDYLEKCLTSDGDDWYSEY